VRPGCLDTLTGVELGVNIPNFGPGTNPARLREWARVVEGLGYDLLMVSDHLAITDDVAAQYPAPFYEPFTTLSWLAGITDRVRLGTTVLIAPYRHPLLVARMAANLDQLSGGRLVLGVGVGWARQEFEALGADFAARGRETDRVLDEIRRAWADGKDYGGARIPIWVGGRSTAGLRRAVRLGDGWHPLRERIDWLRTATKRLQAIAAEEDRPVPDFVPRILLRLTPEPLPDDERVAGEGSLEQVLDDLEVLRELGARSVVLDPFEGDPAETERPETAWQALATIAAHRRQETT
jgi:alkanesulfonate monooxygenase SsuD/methylene tetrahydromethanopterin reductase-like flavin-dependent oxidoreductase (luciferase family)